MTFTHPLLFSSWQAMITGNYSFMISASESREYPVSHITKPKGINSAKLRPASLPRPEPSSALLRLLGKNTRPAVYTREKGEGEVEYLLIFLQISSQLKAREWMEMSASLHEKEKRGQKYPAHRLHQWSHSSNLRGRWGHWIDHITQQ